MAIKTRRGSAGEDVTATEQFVEDVVTTDEDQSYEVEGTDSPEETVQESTVITDDHEVVNPIEDGEIVDEEIEETREGSRKGDSEEEDVEEVIMNEDGDTQEVELPEPDEEEDIKGEDGDTQDVAPSEHDELKGRMGSRKGNAYGGKSEVHQESIKAAVAVAMRDRRL